MTGGPQWALKLDRGTKAGADQIRLEFTDPKLRNYTVTATQKSIAKE